jgi:hypothetical protein
MNRSGSRKPKSKGRPSVRRDEMISHPPQIRGLELQHSCRLRYLLKTSGVAAKQISFQNLLDTLIVATGTTTASDLFQAVKVRGVEIWCPSNVGNGTATGVAAAVSLEFNGTTAGAIGDQDYHTDTSMGIQPAHIKARPSARSQAAQWQLYNAGPAMKLTLPQGSVIDVELSFRSNFAPDQNSGTQNALVGATPGVQYIRGLDGAAVGTTFFIPEFVDAQI